MENRPRGYPQVATFQSSDRNFLQYRCFGYLHCRIISDLQCDIQNLERELDELDQYETQHDQRKLCSKQRDVWMSTEQLLAAGYPAHMKRCRGAVLQKLRGKLIEYGECLRRSREATCDMSV